MKVLVLSTSAWSEQNSMGNTYSSFFDGPAWKNDIFANFYMRNALPDNRVCSNYYRVTPYQILRCFFSPEKIGEHIQIPCTHPLAASGDKKGQTEKKMIARFHRHPSQLVYATMEMLHRSKRWDNDRFHDFLRQLYPDIVFAFLGNCDIWKPLIESIQKHTNAKIVLYATDDTYGAAQKTAWYRRRWLVPELEWCAKNADKLYGASEEICEAYAKLFGRTLTPLYKGCTFEFPVKQKRNVPLRIVYAGNLFYGRADSLAVVAQTLENLNAQGVKARLEIYSNTIPTTEQRIKLNREPHSQIMGVRPYEEIKKILHGADIVLHVESFEQKQIDYVHYSFSTKIIDCLQSGSTTLGIGPKGIASIEYLRSIPGVNIVDELENVPDILRQMLSETEETFARRAQRIRNFASEHHALGAVQDKLHQDFEELIIGESRSS